MAQHKRAALLANYTLERVLPGPHPRTNSVACLQRARHYATASRYVLANPHSTCALTLSRQDPDTIPTLKPDSQQQHLVSWISPCFGLTTPTCYRHCPARSIPMGYVQAIEYPTAPLDYTLFRYEANSTTKHTQEVHRPLPDTRSKRLAHACLSDTNNLLLAHGNATLRLRIRSTRAQHKYMPTSTAVAQDESNLAVLATPTALVDQLTPPTNPSPEQYHDAASQHTGALTTKPQTRDTTGQPTTPDKTITIPRAVTHTVTS